MIESVDAAPTPSHTIPGGHTSPPILTRLHTDLHVVPALLEAQNIFGAATLVRAWAHANAPFTTRDLLTNLGVPDSSSQHYLKNLGAALRMLGFKPRRSEVGGLRAVRWSFRKPDSGETLYEYIQREGPPPKHSLLDWLNRQHRTFTLDAALVVVFETDDVHDHQREAMDARLQMAGCQKVKDLDTGEDYYYPLPKNTRTK